MHPTSELLDKARFAFVMGRADEARRLLEQLVERDPDNGAAWYLLTQVTDDPALRAGYYQRAANAPSRPEPAPGPAFDDPPPAPRRAR
ncbi:MAG TPA: tetratricopeptide repeat protein, partial [Herpetosiphonaceae bacterium]